MKKLFKNIIKRVFTVTIGIAILIYTLIHVTYMYRGYNILNGFYALPKNSIDVAVVGTSVTFSSFMPYDAWHNYGISSYNYCTNVQFQNSLKYSIKDIERTQNPKLIIIDIFPFIYNHNAQNSDWKIDQKELYIKYNLDSRKYQLDRINLVNEIVRDKNGSFSLDDFLYYFFDIVRYHTNDINIDHFNNSKKEINRGYEHFRHVDKQYLINPDELVQTNNKIKKINEKDNFYLKELVEFSKKSKAEILFFCPPICFYDEDSMKQKNYIVEYINNNNCICIDLSNKMDELLMIYSMDYWNINHFDALGAEKITKYLCEYIQKNYDIPDRRDDENYKYLNDDYETWKIMKDEYVFLDLTSVAADKQKGLIKEITLASDDSKNIILKNIATKSNSTKKKSNKVATVSNAKNNTNSVRRINNISEIGPGFSQNGESSPNTKKPNNNRIYSFDKLETGPGINNN